MFEATDTLTIPEPLRRIYGPGTSGNALAVVTKFSDDLGLIYHYPEGVPCPFLMTLGFDIFMGLGRAVRGGRQHSHTTALDVIEPIIERQSATGLLLLLTSQGWDHEAVSTVDHHLAASGVKAELQRIAIHRLEIKVNSLLKAWAVAGKVQPHGEYRSSSAPPARRQSA